MEAEELRMGNIVLFDGEIKIITHKSIYDIYEDDNIALRYRPIPITKEILIKNNCRPFYKDQDGSIKPHVIFQIGIGFISISIFENEIWVFWKGQLIREFEKYHIHQLQNLVYDLTGKELELKL